MNFYVLNIGDRTFECRLTTKDVVKLEKTLGGNPLNVLMSMNEGGLPAIGTMLTVVQAAAKENGKLVKMDEWYDLYDEFLAEGNSIAELLEAIVEIYTISGIIPKESNEPGKE